MTRIFKIFTVFIIAAALLCGCGKPETPAEEPEVSRDPNVPMFTAEPLETEPETEPYSEAVTTAEEITSESETDAPETLPPETEDIEDTQPPEMLPPETEPDLDLPDTKAMDCLKLFNSQAYHAKFIVAQSYDGSEIFTTSVEHFVSGENRTYIVDGITRIIRGQDITVIDNDNKFWFSYTGSYGRLTFGYDPTLYRLVSQTDTEEVYEIEGEDVTSTWTFSDGGIKVSDRLSDGSFTLYDIEALDTDLSGMDISVPPEYEEVNADDYEYYQ